MDQPPVPPNPAPPTAPTPAARPAPWKTFLASRGGFLVIGLVVGGLIGGIAGAGTKSTNTRTSAPTAAPTTTAPATSAAPSPTHSAIPSPAETTPEPTPPFIPEPEDFVLTSKILEKQCFGSAGCLLTYRIQVAYGGLALDPSVTYEVTYEVQGDEDGPQINTLTVTGDQSTVDQEENASTPSSGTKLVAKATSVDVLP